MPELASGASAASWRAADASDLDAIMAIQAEVHPLLQESAGALGNKLALFPTGCRMLQADGVPLAYAIAHPWSLGSVPPLDTVLPRLPEAPDCLYIHDVALLPQVRGQGAGRAYVALAANLACAAGWSALALVSVYDTYPIWQRCGFVVTPLEGLAAKFGPFGATARYMVSRLPGPA